MNNGRDCKHGQLARSCEICGLEAENAALLADRNSWAQQASDRVKDCADFIGQIEALKAELDAMRDQKPLKQDYCMTHGVYFDTRYGCQFCAASLQRTQLAAPGAK